MVGAIRSERWAASDRNRWAAYVRTRKIVGVINNPDEDGGFWLPNIQRPFVWGEDQICRLFDFILREYPISTLPVWKTTSKIRQRRFIDNWKDLLRLSDFYVEESDRKKNLVLDGQQRLESLFIGFLRGTFEGRELYFDILGGELAAPDDIKYKFKFLTPVDASFPRVKFKKLVFSNARSREIEDELASVAGRVLETAEQDKIRNSHRVGATHVYQRRGYYVPGIGQHDNP